MRRFDKFIDEVLLVTIPQQIIVFIDEIDSVLSLPFKLDDFFALIRECYNRRAEKSEYQRLTFTLLGVTTPSDLIQDKQRTPFNIGRPIELMGFELQEAQLRDAAQATREATAKEKHSKQQAQAAEQKRTKAETQLKNAERTTQEAKRSLAIAQQNTKRKEQEAQVAQQKVQEANQKLAEADISLKRADVRLTSATSKELFITGQPFKALLKGLEAGHQLKQLGQAAGTENNTLRVTVLALHQAVYGVQERNSLEKHQSYVNSVSFSPDGKTLASASWDKTVKLWDVASGKETKTLSGHQDSVISVSFSPDGKTLASASSDNTVKLWNFDLDRLMALGCAWVRGYLTTNPKAPDSATVRQACDSITDKK